MLPQTNQCAAIVQAGGQDFSFIFLKIFAKVIKISYKKKLDS
jgi:hypothetical protein